MEASGGGFGLELRPFGGRFWAPGRHSKILRKLAPRHSESTIFEVPGQKRAQNGSETSCQRQPGSKSDLGASGALDHFGVHFELPNRSKNDTENKLIFKRFLGPLEIRGSEILIVILTWFGPGGGETSLIVAMYQRIKDSKTVGINIFI